MQVPVPREVVAQAFWSYHAASQFLEFAELGIARANRAGAAVHRGFLNTAEDVPVQWRD